MTDFADYQDPQANAIALSGTDLTATGLAKESGGNLDTHTTLLEGTATGALVGVGGNTIGKEVAAWIAGGAVGATPGGTPLLHGVKQVYSQSSQVIAASGTFSTGAITFTKPGFMIRVSAQMSGTGAVVPFGKADLSWEFSGSGGAITYEENWYFAAGGTGTVRTNGRGPTKGDTLTITFTNGDATDSMTITVNVWETTHHITRDDWREGGGVTSANATPAKGVGLANIIANDSFTAPGAATSFRNMPLYAGLVNVWINQNTAGGSQVTIVPVGAFDLASINPIASLDWTLAPHQQVGVVLPRCPCQIQATNNAAGGVIFTYGVTAVEYAS